MPQAFVSQAEGTERLGRFIVHRMSCDDAHVLFINATLFATSLTQPLQTRQQHARMRTASNPIFLQISPTPPPFCVEWECKHMHKENIFQTILVSQIFPVHHVNGNTLVGCLEQSPREEVP